MRCYSELILLSTFEDRLEYLRLDGIVGDDTFGSHRYMNQQFYNSTLWKGIRDAIMIRDNGCDLGVIGREIPNHTLIFVHHINPITIDDIRFRTDRLLNPENLILVTKDTHNAIHYGSEVRPVVFTERKKNDTCPWRR